MKVILRPLRQDNWSGIIKYKNCYEDLSPYFTRSGSIYTGLIKANETRLGEELGLDLSKGSEFWNTFYIRTADRDIILETEDPMDELKYLFLKSHKRVKNSLFEHKATANFVLINQNEEAKKDNLFGRLKRQAIREFDKMTTEEMKKALRLFGKSAENLNSEVAENRLFEIVEGDPSGFIEKWVNNKERETQYMIERAISMNVIRKNKRLYTYGTDTIGHGLEEAIAYLNDPKNQDLKISIKQQIEGKSSLDKVTKENIIEEVKESVAKKVKKEHKKKDN